VTVTIEISTGPVADCTVFFFIVPGPGSEIRKPSPAKGISAGAVVGTGTVVGEERSGLTGANLFGDGLHPARSSAPISPTEPMCALCPFTTFSSVEVVPDLRRSPLPAGGVA